MKKRLFNNFQIWREGYATNGERDTAKFIGMENSTTFEEAVKLHMLRHPELGIEKRGKRYCIWGCFLYDNEADARKTFG